MMMNYCPGFCSSPGILDTSYSRKLQNRQCFVWQVNFRYVCKIVVLTQPVGWITESAIELHVHLHIKSVVVGLEWGNIEIGFVVDANFTTVTHEVTRGGWEYKLGATVPTCDGHVRVGYLRLMRQNTGNDVKRREESIREDLVMPASHYDVQLELYCLACCWFSELFHDRQSRKGFLLSSPWIPQQRSRHCNLQTIMKKGTVPHPVHSWSFDINFPAREQVKLWRRYWKILKMTCSAVPPFPFWGVKEYHK